MNVTLSDTVIRATNISKSFVRGKNEEVVLQNLDFSVAPGEIVGVMGPSGCGKSTLLQVLGGIHSISSGKLELFGQDCSYYIPKSIKENIGYVFQESNLLPWRSVEENLSLAFEMHYREDKQKKQKKINEVLEMVGLSDYGKAIPLELSGGMMQRVGIARALVLEPSLLLLDQPFGALDALTRKKLRLDFLRIFEKAQNTIVIVTNSIDEALLFSNRIFILSEHGGEIEHKINVDIPHSERKTDVAYDPQFDNLRKKMIDIVSAQYASSGIREV